MECTTEVTMEVDIGGYNDRIRRLQASRENPRASGRTTASGNECEGADFCIL